MKLLFNLSIVVFLSIFFFSCNENSDNIIHDLPIYTLDASDMVYPTNIMHFSQDFYLAVKYDEPIDAFVDTLSRINSEILASDLISFEHELSFWINIYNSLVQYKLLIDSNAFKNTDDFFKTSNLVIAGHPISLDEIEHGIIRGKKYSNPIVDLFQLEKLDYRIHFTMNCGASSCPAIAYYKPESLEQDLSDAEKVFISSTSSYDSLSNTLNVSELFDWFKEDFGDEKGVLSIMIRNNVLPMHVVPEINFVPYNWNLESKNYK